MKDKLIIIGANEFQEPLILKSRQLGYETHVFAWEEGAVGKESADFFYPISITEKEKILTKAREIKPKGVVSIASDLAVLTVNYLSHHLGLTGNSLYSSEVSTNKYKMRQIFLEHSLPSPKFVMVDSSTDLTKIGMTFPLIVKPVDRSGSRGVTKVNNYKELYEAVKVALNESFSGIGLVEEFVEGKEYSIEMISYKGKHHFLAITEKFTTGEPHFIETMHIQPANLNEELLKKIISTLQKALDALDIKYGASHSEIKIKENGDFNIIEIGARMGGDCIGSDLVKLSTGNDFVKMVIDTSVGKDPLLNIQKEEKKNYALVKFLFNKDDLDNLEIIKNKYPHNVFRISRIIHNVGRKILDSSTRLGYFILCCQSYAECIDIVQQN